jgi:hypothetical protein
LRLDLLRDGRSIAGNHDRSHVPRTLILAQMHRARSNKRLAARITVEFGVEATDGFDLDG